MGFQGFIGLSPQYIQKSQLLTTRGEKEPKENNGKIIMPWHHSPDLSQRHVSEFPTNFAHTFLDTQTACFKALSGNSVALMGAEQTHGKHAYIILKWAKCRTTRCSQEVLCWTDLRLSLPLPVKMSFDSMYKWRNNRPDSQMVSGFQRHNIFKRDVHYFYTLIIGTDCWASDTLTAFPAVHTAYHTRGTQTAWEAVIPTVNKET